MPKPKITLYQFEACPFCKLVREELKEKGLKYEKIEIPRDRDAQIRKEISKKSGVKTVPVIKIDNKFIGESQDIIEYLNKEF